MNDLIYVKFLRLNKTVGFELTGFGFEDNHLILVSETRQLDFTLSGFDDLKDHIHGRFINQ